MDLDGNLLFAKSEREIGLERIIEEVSRYGKTVLVTTDVTPAPDLARKVASKLKAALFTPSRSMEVPEKRELVNRFSQMDTTDLSDAHVRDALASGIKALQRYKNKFQKLDSQVAHDLPASSKEHTKELILKGFSIARAIKESVIQPPYPVEVIIQPKRFEQNPNTQKAILEKAEVIARLDDLVEDLKQDIKSLKAKNFELTIQLERERARSSTELRKDRLYTTQRNQIAELKKRIRELEEPLNRCESGEIHDENFQSFVIDSNLTLLKPIESFTSEGLQTAVDNCHIESGDPVIVKDASGGGASTAKALARLRPSVVITCTAMSDQAQEVLVQNSIPIVKSNLLSIRNVREKSYVLTEELDSVVTNCLIEETIDKYREDKT